MRQSDYIYNELLLIAKRVGFEVERNMCTPERLSLELGTFLNKRDSDGLEDSLCKIKISKRDSEVLNILSRKGLAA